MANDIKKIDSSKDINTIQVVCSTRPTGGSSTLMTQVDYPLNLTIESIQSKFDERFDDPTYPYDCTCVKS